MIRREIDPSLLIAGGQPRPFLRDLEIGYLLQCNFNALEPYAWKPEPLLSGWESDKSGGTWAYQYKREFDHDWFKLIDDSPTAAVTIKHQIARQREGRLTLEYRFKMPSNMDGACWQLRDFEQAAVSLVTAGGNLCWENGQGEPTVLQPYELNREYGVKVIADLTAKKADLYMDGSLVRQGLPFAHPVGSIDYVLIKTGNAATGELFLSPVNIHKGYVVNETFVTCNPGKVPSEWTTTPDNVSVEEFLCRPKPDVFSLKLNGSTSNKAAAEKHFAAATGPNHLRISLPAAGERKTACDSKAAAAETPGITICTAKGNLCYDTGDRDNPVSLVKDYRANLWYMIKIVANPKAQEADIYVNGKLMAEHAKFPRLTSNRFVVVFHPRTNLDR